MNIGKIAPWLAGAGLLGGPAAYFGYKQLQNMQPKEPPAPPPGSLGDIAALAKEYLGNPVALTGGTLGTVLGALVSQHMRQPLPGTGGRPVEMTKRPGELIPGAMGGAALGMLLGNMLRQSRQKPPAPIADIMLEQVQ